VTEQLEVVVVPIWLSEQVVPGMLNAPVPLEVKLTVPAGADFVPAAVSETIAVQMVDWLTKTDAGKQVTVVLVPRFVTVMSKKPLLGVWVAEPP